MEILLYILPIFFTHLFGLFDGAQTARKDYPYTHNRIWDYYEKMKMYKYKRWYMGGNENYPPGNPLKCDFWHFMKWCWTLCISAIAISVVLVSITYPSHWLLGYIFLYGIEGFSFSFYYSYVFRTDKTFKQFIKERDLWFIPFVNNSFNQK